jgi:lysozyme
MEMKISEQGLALIKRFEGLRLSAYRCPSGVWTIGYGHTGGVAGDDMIDEAGADAYLREDVKMAVAAINDLLIVPLTQNQFDVLVSFTFNCGVGALRKSTLLRLLNTDNYDAVPDQLMRWTKGAGGKILPGLILRRKAEVELWNQEVP